MDIKDNKLIQTEIISINTKDRDKIVFPNPQQCDLFIPPIKQVVKGEIVSSQIPHSQYPVNAKNNQFVATSSASPAVSEVTLTLTPGNYTAAELATEVQTQLNGATFLNGAKSTCVFNTTTRKFEINRTDGGGTITMLFGSNVLPTSSAVHLLGYTEEDVGPATDVSPPNVANIGGDDYILLYIDGLNNSFSASRSRYFAKFQMDVAYGYYSMNKFICNPMEFRRGANFRKLSLRFEDPNGQLVLFNNQDASFDIRFTYIAG